MIRSDFIYKCNCGGSRKPRSGVIRTTRQTRPVMKPQPKK